MPSHAYENPKNPNATAGLSTTITRVSTSFNNTNGAPNSITVVYGDTSCKTLHGDGESAKFLNDSACPCLMLYLNCAS